MNEEGTFMWAVEMMKQGKKVRRNQHNNTLPWGNDGSFYVLLDSEEKNYYQFSISHIQSTDWEVVEEPKKTLSDKSYNIADKGEVFGLEENGNLFLRDDVREALKEYIGKVKARYNQYFNNEKESNYNNKIFEDAKDIFGEELLR